MADPRPGVGQPRMTVAEEPEYQYGTRKNGLPHEQWVYSQIWTLTQQGEDALTISQHDGGVLGMTADEVSYVMKKQRERGKPFPEAYGRSLGSGKFTMEHYDFICRWLLETGARKTIENMVDALAIRFGLFMSQSGLKDVLKRFGICHKRLTKEDKRATRLQTWSSRAGSCCGAWASTRRSACGWTRCCSRARTSGTTTDMRRHTCGLSRWTTGGVLATP